MSQYNPSFCPNFKCLFHKISHVNAKSVKARGGANHTTAFYYRNGFYDVRGERVARFRCRYCSYSFSERAFHFNYRFKKIDTGLSAKILNVFILSSSNRQIARHCHISEHCVRNRLDRMARWAMLIHQDKIKGLGPTREDLCYDGLQNFAASQYDPNYINQVIGRDSLFIYDFNFSPLNREGMMSDRQKLKMEAIEKAYGRYPDSAVQKATSVLFSRIFTREKAALKSHAATLLASHRAGSCGSATTDDGTSAATVNYIHAPLKICSDEHYQYKQAFNVDLKKFRSLFEHVTVSSKKTRNYQNILFAVNHADLLIRHQVKAFTRETIAFCKTPARMCQKYALFMVYKNYFSPQFTKALKTRPDAHKQSPAQYLGLASKVLKFHEFFSELRTITQVNPPKEWKMFIGNKVPYARG